MTSRLVWQDGSTLFKLLYAVLSTLLHAKLPRGEMLVGVVSRGGVGEDDGDSTRRRSRVPFRRR